MRVIWSDLAIRRLEEIRSFIAADAPATAESIVRRLIGSTERLTDFPHAGRVVPEYSAKDIREIIDPPYRILYRVFRERIEIISVIHSRQMLK
ncbi:MAG: type II toxin-antitoxin system RelE/ParE family toxin [Bacteroidetes bacterium]|nr:type II toxin-antitoxin system RelE/ParE family toxin [Bacteroidota bacterium]